MSERPEPPEPTDSRELTERFFAELGRLAAAGPLEDDLEKPLAPAAGSPTPPAQADAAGQSHASRRRNPRSRSSGAAQGWRRRVFAWLPTRMPRWLPLALFLATCGSTLFAGGAFAEPLSGVRDGAWSWAAGLEYMAAVMTILLGHELGHFVQTLRCGVRATLPLFLPMPLSPLGTFGAVIVMDARNANRRHLFDIGLTGPLVGLVLTLGVSWWGISAARVVPQGELPQGEGLLLVLRDPPISEWMNSYLHPELTAEAQLSANSLCLAGWVGLFLTGLNLLPIGQLDGGHVAYALFGRRAHRLAQALLVVSAGYMLWTQYFAFALFFALLLWMGVKHPPTADDAAPLGWVRRVLGAASLTLPLLTLAPRPVDFIEADAVGTVLGSAVLCLPPLLAWGALRTPPVVPTGRPTARRTDDDFSRGVRVPSRRAGLV